MFRLKLNLLQCFISFLMLWPAIVNSFPTKDLALNNRYQRDTPETEFPQNGGSFELVIQDEEQKVFEFEVCCNKANGCNGKTFTFCFPSLNPSTIASVYATSVSCSKPKTCAYQINFDGFNTTDNTRRVKLFLTPFSPTSECFKGRITSTDMSASNTETDLVKVDGCPLEFDTKKRFIINILNTIPDGVTVKALNAQKYVEPTTLPPSTAPPTAETTNTSKEATPAPATKEETGMSDALKYSLMGVGIFVFILVAGGSAFAIYWFCFKKKKSSKPAPQVTVAKSDTAAAKHPSTAAPIMPPEVKPQEKKKAEKETKDVEDSKLAPSTVVPPSAAPKLPPPPTATKEPSAVPSRLELQKSSLPGPSLVPSSVINPPARVRQEQPSVLPPATPTVADLIGRVGRRYRVAGRKFFDTFDRVQTPHYEGIMDSMIRNGWITEEQALKVKKEKFIRPPSEEELKLFAAPISVMYQLLEELIDDAAYYHNKTIHDENAPCILIVNEFHTYFVSLYAVVVHYAKYFKIGKDVRLEKCSVPLLLGIAMDRSQTESLRRRALVIMTIKAVDMTRIFTEAQCIKLPYPMCVICLSYQLDRYLVDNVDRLHTYSSPNNSECTISDDGKRTGGGAKSVAGSGRADGGKKESSSSKAGTKTSVSKEVVAAAVEKKKKVQKKGKKH